MSTETESVRRLRVLQLGKFYAPVHGGMESHLQTLCEGLRQNVEVEALVSNTGSRTVRETCNGVPVVRLARLFRVRSASINPSMLFEIRRHPAEIVHLHWPNPMAAAAYLASGHRGRLVVTYHCDVVRQRVLRWLFNPLLTAVLRRACSIIVSSQELLESSPTLQPYRDRCRVIPLGVAKRYFLDPDPAEVQQARLRFGEELVLGVGRMVEYKGFEYLIRAIHGTSARLLLIGRGPARRRLQRLVAQLKLQDRVCFLGELPEQQLRVLYHAADMLVLPSLDRSEAFGLVQAEAMAAALPVINTALGTGVPSVSLHEVTGLTVPPANAPALAQAIHRLLANKPYRGMLGLAARARAHQLFHSKTMCRRIHALYREMSSGR